MLSGLLQWHGLYLAGPLKYISLNFNLLLCFAVHFWTVADVVCILRIENPKRLPSLSVHPLAINVALLPE